MNQIDRIGVPIQARVTLHVTRGSRALPFLGLFLFLVVLGQAAIVVQARPQDLISGMHGMADILRRSFPVSYTHLVTDQLPRSGIATLASYVTVACIAVGLVSAWLGLCVITG